MTDDIRSAAKRCRGLDEGWIDLDSMPTACVVDLLTLARAWLAANPHDSDTPITTEWLESVGFVPRPGSRFHRQTVPEPGGIGVMWDARDGKLLVGFAGRPDVWDVVVETSSTRSDVRRLAAALGVELRAG